MSMARCSIKDNGRGIPVEMHPKFGTCPPSSWCSPTCTPAASSARAPTNTPAVCTGSAPSASTRSPTGSRPRSTATAKSTRSPSSAARPRSRCTSIGDLDDPSVTGTMITFFPDATIFTDTIEFKFDRLAKRLRELAFLNPGLTIDPRPTSARTSREVETVLLQRRRSPSSSASWWRTKPWSTPSRSSIHGEREVEYRLRGQGHQRRCLSSTSSCSTPTATTDQILRLRQLDSQRRRRHPPHRLPHRPDPRHQHSTPRPTRSSRTRTRSSAATTSARASSA